MQQSGTECDFSSSDSWVILSPIDQSTEREMLRKLIKRYLQIQYEDWNEEHLRYRKGSFMAGGAEADAEETEGEAE